MEIAKVRVSGVRAETVWAEPIPVGISGATVTLEFDDPRWASLEKHILFVGAKDVPVLFAEESVELPAEVATVPNIVVKMGIWGIDAENNMAIPTLWAELGTVRPAADKEMGSDQKLPVWAQMLGMIGNLRELGTEAKNNLVAAINEAMSKSGTAGGYYTPVVTQPTTNTMKTAFVPSVATMPAVEPVTITLPGSDSGQDKTGGFVVQDTAPEDTSVLWIDTSDNGFDSPPNSGDYLPMPSTASVGQYIVVSAVDEGGKVTAVEATDAPTLPSAEGVAF